MKRVEGTSGIRLIECVSPARNSRLTLSHTYRLYKDLIETGSFTKNNRFTRLTGYPTQRTCRRTGADERFGMDGELLHTRLITQDTALTALATGVDGKHCQLTLVFFQHMQAEDINRGTFSSSRHATDPHTDRVP